MDMRSLKKMEICEGLLLERFFNGLNAEKVWKRERLDGDVTKGIRSR